MKISIIIPTWNHLEDCLKPCCESIIRNTTFQQENRTLNVVVVANGCNDGTEEYVKSLGESFSCISFDKSIGYPAAINAGIKKCQDSDYLILMNNDIQILDWGKDTWLDAFVEPFNRFNDCVLSGSLPNYSHEVESDFIIFCCVMISKRTVKEIGLLDEIFTPGGCEDIDYCMRIKQRGYHWYIVPLDQPSFWKNRFYCNQHALYHAAEQTVFGIPQWNEIFQRNCEIVKSKYYSPTRKLSTKSFSIIIPTSNNLENLKICCESLMKNTLFTDESEVIVVANNCFDGTHDYVLSLGKFFKLFMFQQNLDFFGTVNEALRLARGDHMIILHDDVVILDWGKNIWTDILTQSFDSNVGLVGPVENDFFCMALNRRVFSEVGYLDNSYFERLAQKDYYYRQIDLPIWHRGV